MIQSHTEEFNWFQNYIRYRSTPSSPYELYDLGRFPHQTGPTMHWAPVVVKGVLLSVTLSPPIANTMCERCSGHWGVWSLLFQGTIVAMRMSHSSLYRDTSQLRGHLERNVWSGWMDVTDGIQTYTAETRRLLRPEGVVDDPDPDDSPGGLSDLDLLPMGHL